MVRLVDQDSILTFRHFSVIRPAIGSLSIVGEIIRRVVIARTKLARPTCSKGVKDKVTRETFNSEESERLLRGFLSPALFEAGLVCRADDRGDPVVQLAPPLICDQEHFDLITQILRDVLGQAMSRI